MYIYKTTNLINGKIYIGQSSKTIQSSIEYYGSGTILRLAIHKYGKENFKKEILFEASSIKEMNEKEIFYIKELKSQDTSVGYNLAGGGTGGDTSKFIDYTNPERLKKISESVSGKKNGNYGKQMTDEDKLKNPKFFDNHKKGKDNPNYGSKTSDVTKLKQSKSSMGENNSNYGNCWCVLKTADNKSKRKVFPKDNIPDNWISCSEFDDIRKKKNHHYGKKWFNDGIKNYLRLPEDATNLIKGRIGRTN